MKTFIKRVFKTAAIGSTGAFVGATGVVWLFREPIAEYAVKKAIELPGKIDRWIDAQDPMTPEEEARFERRWGHLLPSRRYSGRYARLEQRSNNDHPPTS